MNLQFNTNGKSYGNSIFLIMTSQLWFAGCSPQLVVNCIISVSLRDFIELQIAGVKKMKIALSL